MKNKYEIRGDVTAIFINRKGKFVETLIETKDLNLVQSFPNTWFLMGFGKYVGGYTDQWNPEKKKTWLLHRFIMSEPIGMMIDHINHDALDNRKINLRLATHSENQQNLKGARKQSKSGIRGVTWIDRSKKWNASMQVDKKRIDLGNFLNKEEAERAVEEARALHMPFSKEAKSNIELTGITEQNRKTMSEVAFRNNESSKVRGVTWYEKGRSWKAYYKIGSVIHLGYYKDLNVATQVVKLFREKAKGIDDKNVLLDIKRSVISEITSKEPSDSRKKLYQQSGIAGINWKANKWIVRVHHKGRRFNVGVFLNLKDAIEAKDNYEHSLK